MRLAMIGTGGIVKEALTALKEVPSITCQAIWAREHSLEKARNLANEYHILQVYTNYEALLAADDIDFVYIGLVNSAHYAFARQALLAGKHVIVEKPFASTRKETKELLTLAQEKHLYLFEAVTLLHMPNFRAVQKNLAEIGNVKMVQCNYSQYSSRYASYRQGKVLPAFDPALSGGALYDINVYNLQFVIGLFGSPAHVQYIANKGFNGIDTSGILLLQYDHFAAVCVGAKDSASDGHLIIQAEEGTIYGQGAPNELRSLVVTKKDQQALIEENCYAHRMVHEFISFADIYARKDYACCLKYMQITEQVMAVLEEARKQAGISFPADTL